MHVYMVRSIWLRHLAKVDKEGDSMAQPGPQTLSNLTFDCLNPKSINQSAGCLQVIVCTEFGDHMFNHFLLIARKYTYIRSQL